MSRTIEVIYDGEVFRPVTPPDIEPNTHGRVVIENEKQETKKEDAWDVLEQLSGTVEAPEDWSSNHDYYLYGPGKNWHGRQE